MMIERFDNVRLARAFSDYLRSLGIAHRLQPDGTLWLDDVAQQARVMQELERFRHDPMHPRYLGASWQAPPPADEVDALSRRYGSGDLSPGRLLRSRGPLTLAVLLLCVAVGGWSGLGTDRTAVEALLFPASSAQFAAEWWRAVTPVFLHFGIAHIVFNLGWWWLLGGAIEREQGMSTLLLVTLVTALASNLAQFLVSGPGFGGLSGVVFGLIGYFWWYVRAHPGYGGYRMPKAMVNFAVLWLALGYVGVLDALFGPVANTAHLGGLVAGGLLGNALGRRQRRIDEAAGNGDGT
ncbi:MAG: rhomboid family intramembrane serine protease GlpG [Pseudomonadota bacterium]